jgi:S-DNA-T family DNA segregation ATPase FtsK/SpoIIIE
MPPVLKLPSEAELPEGPRRALVVALHHLYKGAMRPSLRGLAVLISEDENLSGTASHETIRRLLRGETLPEWPQVQAVAAALHQLAEQRRGTTSSGPLPSLETIAQLWDAASDETRPPRNSAVVMADLSPVRSEAADVPAIPYGLQTLPGRGKQPVVIDFSHFSHMLALGGPRSGRSQLLRTIAGFIARDHTCADVHIFGIDCGNGALLALEELPHCGAVVTRRQTDRAQRLLNRLSAELERRQDVYDSTRGAARRRALSPRLLILVDRADRLDVTFTKDVVEGLDRIVREGDEVGLHVVATGDGTLRQSMMARLVDDKLLFRLPDLTDHTSLGVPIERARALQPGTAVHTATAAEVTVALLSEIDQEDALSDLAAQAVERDVEIPEEQRPFRVASVPRNLTFDYVWRLWPMKSAGMSALIGLGGDELRAIGVDLSAGLPGFVIAGSANSGKSTLLLTMGISLLKSGTGLIVAAPRQSPVRALAGHAGVHRVFTDADFTAEDLREAQSQVRSANVAFLIDDVELLYDVTDADEVMEEAMKERAGNVAFLVAGDDEKGFSRAYRGFGGLSKDAQRGILLGVPWTRADREVIGGGLPRDLEFNPRIGRGLLHLGDRRVIPVALPQPPELS